MTEFEDPHDKAFKIIRRVVLGTWLLIQVERYIEPCGALRFSAGAMTLSTFVVLVLSLNVDNFLLLLYGLLMFLVALPVMFVINVPFLKLFSDIART